MKDQVSATQAPYTGSEFLESIRDGREIYIHGERVKDVTTHPAFRNSARMIARVYDAMHDPKTRDIITAPTENGGRTHRYFLAPKTVEDQVASRDAIAETQRVTYGWMGRSPDYKGSFLATLGANAAFYRGYEQNALRWYRKAQERTAYINHAIMNPPVDRTNPRPTVRMSISAWSRKTTPVSSYRVRRWWRRTRR